MAIAYIGIGSNLGNREETCEKAITLLENKGINITKRSPMIETEPWGVQDQPKFINMAVEVETGCRPQELLQKLKEIEATLGRRKERRWGPRNIDLDILFYNSLVVKTPELEIPHPHIQERAFILKPLSEIAPDKIHPVLKRTVRELLLELQSTH
jgi:2-amino-4-hydroxy-6-hydroxymethyldihydropteridine diphosphokinase